MDSKVQHSNFLKGLRSKTGLSSRWPRQYDAVNARNGGDRLHLFGGTRQWRKLFACQIVKSPHWGGGNLPTPTVACDEISFVTICHVSDCQERHVRSSIHGVSFQEVKHRGRGRIGDDMILEDIVALFIDQSIERQQVKLSVG